MRLAPGRLFAGHEMEEQLMKGQLETNLGTVVIDEDVLGKYAGSAAVGCFGVVGMASSWCQYVNG